MEPTILGLVLEAGRLRLDAARFLKHIATRIGVREAACAIRVVELATAPHVRMPADTPCISR